MKSPGHQHILCRAPGLCSKIKLLNSRHIFLPIESSHCIQCVLHKDQSETSSLLIQFSHNFPFSRLHVVELCVVCDGPSYINFPLRVSNRQTSSHHHTYLCSML